MKQLNLFEDISVLGGYMLYSGGENPFCLDCILNARWPYGAKKFVISLMECDRNRKPVLANKGTVCHECQKPI